MITDVGFADAKRLLKVHFGDELRIANAYMEKALTWGNLKAEDGNAMLSYALLLRGCCNTMQDLPDIRELDLPSNIISKLPFKIKEIWRKSL